jgi:cation:H+ antiporter
MILSIFLIIFGLVLLVVGANTMIRGASALAASLGVPPVVIGLTIVAFGTSAPELVVNVTAAISGKPQLAFGSIIGSSTINLGWVLAITALVRPIKVERSIISREIPMMLLGTLAFGTLAADQFFDHRPDNLLTRGNGIILLLLFCVFLYYTISSVLVAPKKLVQQDPFAEEIAGALEKRRPLTMPLSVGLTIGGLVMLVTGGRLTVYAAVKVASALGMPEFLIGLTIISFGTTLPELVTGILATRRGEGDLALGNVVGSNIFNLLFIGGTVSVISPIPVPPGGLADLLLLAILTAISLPIAIRGQRTITRAEGAFLIILYLSYLAWRVSSST